MWGIMRHGDPGGAPSPPRLSRESRSVPSRMDELPAVGKWRDAEPMLLPQLRLGAGGAPKSPSAPWPSRLEELLAERVEQISATVSEGQQQQRRHGSALGARCDRLELRLQELEQTAAAAGAKTEGLAGAVAVLVAAKRGGAAADSAAATSQGELARLRAEVEREVASREALGSEVASQMRSLAGTVQRQQAEVASAPQSAAAAAAGVQPRLEALWLEVESLRLQADQTSRECSRRCADAEAACSQRAAGAREAALSSGKELLEGQQGLLEDCMASIASLRGAMEAKDAQQDGLLAELAGLARQAEASALERAAAAARGHEEHAGRLASLEEAAEARAGDAPPPLPADQARERARVDELVKGLQAAREEWRGEAQRLWAEALALRRGAEADPAPRGATAQRGAAEEAGRTLLPSGGVDIQELRDVEARLQRQIGAAQETEERALARAEAALRAEARTVAAEVAAGATAEAASQVEGRAATRWQAARQEAAEERRRLRDDLDQRLALMDETRRRGLAEVRQDLQDLRAAAQVQAERAAREAKEAATDAMKAQLDTLGRWVSETASAELRAALDEIGAREAGMRCHLLTEVAALEARLPLAGVVSPAHQQRQREERLQQLQLEGAAEAGAAAAAMRLEELERKARSADASLRAWLEQGLSGLVEVQSNLAREVMELWQAQSSAAQDTKASIAALHKIAQGKQAPQGSAGLPALPEARPVVFES